MSTISSPAAIPSHTGTTRYSLKNKFISMFRSHDPEKQHYSLGQRKSTPAAKKLTRNQHYGDGTVKSGSFDNAYHYRCVNVSQCVERRASQAGRGVVRRKRKGDRVNCSGTATLPVGKSLSECYQHYLCEYYRV